MSNPIRKSPAPLRPAAPPSKAAPARPAALGAFPQVRPRRNRSDAWLRRLVAENRLGTEDLIWPVFVHDGDGRRWACAAWLAAAGFAPVADHALFTDKWFTVFARR